jgi:hypothetical protein
MKKLLCVVPHLSSGGLPQVLVKKIEILKNDLDIYVVEYSNVSNDFVIQKNRLKKLLKPDHFFTLGDNKYEILEIIKKVQPDFIHFEEMPEFFMEYNLAKLIYVEDRKYKIFETTHSSDYIVDDKKFFPDKFLFVSQYNSFKFNKLNVSSQVIEYPVEKRERPTPERKLELQKKLGLDPNFKHVVNVGLFTRRKNQGYAFEIARQMEDKPVKFHFIGNQAGNFEDYWKPIMKNVPKNVQLWGERDDVFDFYDACDLFLFTSRGFRYDKELNPLVIKEALEHQIPQFIFPLDVYNRKYDIESNTIRYLFGDLKVDAGLVRNFLFPRDMSNVKTPKIRAVHLLLEEDDRGSESIKEMEKLKEFGIDYVQHINKRFTEKPPKEGCVRPWDVERLGSYSLRGPHYGNYTSFRNAILTEFTEDVDYLMVMESDCKLTVPMEEFVSKVFESCDKIQRYGIQYMSFGDNKNLRTGEMVSDIQEPTDVPWMYVTNKIIGIQCIMFPKEIKNFVQRSYETMLWDVSDLYFNDVFKYKRKGIAPGLTTQIEGLSTIQGEDIKHFLLKNENNLLNDKNPNDILVEFMEDNKFHFVLSDFYQNTIEGIKIDVIENEQSIYSTISSLSPNSSTWIQLHEWERFNVLHFEFTYKGTILFRKELIMKKVDVIVPEPIVEIPIVEEVIETIIEEVVPKNVDYEEIIEIKPENFTCEFNVEENKVNIFYSNDHESKYKVLVTDIDSNYPIFSKDMDFNKNFYNWTVPSHINFFKAYDSFNGFNVHFYTGDKKEFSKEIRLRNTKPICNIIFDTEDWSNKDRYYEIFHEDIYKFLNISSKDKCVIDLNNDELFVLYAKEKGVEIAIDINHLIENQDDLNKIDSIDLLKCDNFNLLLIKDKILSKIKRIYIEYDTHSGLISINEKLKNLGFTEVKNTHNSSYYVKESETISITKCDDLYVVLTYPDTKIKEKVTIDCINSIKNNTDKPILVASHYPLTKEIQNLSNFYLYDSYNPLIEHTLYKFYWSEMNNVKIELNLDKLNNGKRLNQSLTVLNNIENSVRFAKEAGYERIICTSYDFIFSEENIKTIDNICERLDKENKKGYFMSYKEGDMTLLKTVFFIINVDTYINTFTNPRYPEKYNEECQQIGSHNFLENYFNNKLYNNFGKFLIEETDEEKLFNNPNINIFSGVEYLTVIPVKNQSAFVIFYTSSNKKDDRRIDFIIENNGSVEQTVHYVKERSYFYKIIELGIHDNWKITVNFIDSNSNEKLDEVHYQVDKDSFINILGNGLFTEK